MRISDKQLDYMIDFLLHTAVNIKPKPEFSVKEMTDFALDLKDARDELKEKENGHTKEN